MTYRDDPQVQTMIENMPTKTGKTLGAWLEVLAASSLKKHGEMMKLLKGEYSVSHGYANIICLIFRQENAPTPPPTPADLVAQQYAGKESLIPIYDKLITYALALGEDIDVAPKKKNVSLRRKKQFALIQPTTRTRVDLGIQLKGSAPEGKLEDGKMWGGMCSHRIKLATPGDVDEEVQDWLGKAYDAAG